MSPSLLQVVIYSCPITIIIPNDGSEVRKGICRSYLTHINPNGDQTYLKTVFQGLPLDPSWISEPSPIQLVGENINPPQGTWISQRSHLWKGERRSSKILMLSTQCWWLKWFWIPFQVQEDSWNPGKGQGHCLVPFGNMPSYTWGRCYVWLPWSRFQSIDGYVPCILLRCVIIDPAVS